MRDLHRSFYVVTTDAPAGAQATPATSLEDFAEMLPHGSGFDGNWHVAPNRRGITLTTEWHAMNQGGYVGWFPVRVVLTRGVDGRLDVHSVRVNARATNDAGDYIADCIADVCRAASGRTD